MFDMESDMCYSETGEFDSSVINRYIMQLENWVYFTFWFLYFYQDFRVRTKIISFLFLSRNICCGYLNRLDETVLLCTQNIARNYK